MRWLSPPVLRNATAAGVTTAMLSAHHVVRQVGEMAVGRATATVGPVVEGLEEAPETRRLIEGFRLPQ